MLNIHNPNHVNQIPDNSLSVEDRNQLVIDNMGLVYKIANKCYNYNNRYFDDIVQAGMLGVIHASKKFDPDKGCKFSTYCVFWMKAYMDRSYKQYSNIIYIPESFRRKVKKQTDLIGKDFINSVYNIESLDEPFIYNDVNKYDIIIDEKADSPERVFEMVSGIALAQFIIKQLEERERIVIQKSFVEERTLSDIGKSIGLSREGVRQIKEIALEKIRKQFNNERLRWKDAIDIMKKDVVEKGIKVDENKNVSIEKVTVKHYKEKPKVTRQFEASGLLLSEVSDGRIYYLSNTVEEGLKWKLIPDVPL